MLPPGEWVMGEFEGIGDIVTSGLSAGAVEPAVGSGGARGDGACLNCRTALTGPFCSACGQKARVHRSLGSFLHDMIQGLFNFEGKIWRTLPMLAWSPGEMTRRYVAGERARYVSPVALYLFSVFLMFAVLNFTGAMKVDSISTKLTQSSAEEKAELAKLETQRAATIKRGAEDMALDRRIAAKKKDVAELDRVRNGGPIQIEGLDDTPAGQWLGVAALGIQRNPQAFMIKVQDAASKFSWLLIPLSVPFLWLLFPLNRRYHLYDHTVFVTYSLSFMMMLVIAGGLLVSLGAPSFASMLFFLPPIHMYRQLKGAYQLSRISALVHTLLLVSFAFVVSILFLMMIFAIGIL
ncbi:MAG: DUF3667 domain-containing protein [Sphingomonas bacterium]|nr:DUF3667 domain-containing protein [Sphingomonas bacterium]